MHEFDATHPHRRIRLASQAVFAGNALEKLEKSAFKEVIVTNSIPEKKKSKKVTVVSIAPLMAEAIRCVNENKSISRLLNPSK